MKLLGRSGFILAPLLLIFILAMLLRPAFGQAQSAAAGTGSDTGTVVCRIGVNVEDLYDLDMARDSFGAILWIWSLCPSADRAPLATITFPTASGELSQSPIEVVDLASGGQYASRRVLGTFRYDWDMDHYPFDRQRVVIPIDEAQYGAARLTFEPDRDESFVSPDVRDRLDEWAVSDLVLEASVSEEPSTYGLPEAEAGYARLEAAITLQRADLVTFLKLTAGAFAGAFFAFLSLFYDPNDRSAFGGKLGLLVGVLFALLLSLRNVDASIGDTGQLTLVTRIHLISLALIVVLALAALRDRRRVERGLSLCHPDWPMLVAALSVYTVSIGAMILVAASS
jgi:hypothetical protein